MAYVTPITFVALATLTAAQLNSIQSNITDHETRILAVEAYTHVVAVCQKSAAQTINNNTSTIIDFDSVEVDTDSAITTGASWHFAAPRTGAYILSVSVALASSSLWAADEQAQVYVYKNGSINVPISWFNNYVNVVYMIGAVVIYLAATDTIDIRTLQISDGNIVLSVWDTRFAISSL
jgi:hypothetical protein